VEWTGQPASPPPGKVGTLGDHRQMYGPYFPLKDGEKEDPELGDYDKERTTMAEQRPKGNAKFLPEARRPMFYRSETWHASSGPEALKAKFMEAFRDKPYAVKTLGDEIQVTPGSKALYKIWGELVPWGQNNAPVGLTLSVKSAPEGGSEVTAAAFDRFGFRWTDKTFFGAEENFTSKMDHLIQAARSASEV